MAKKTDVKKDDELEAEKAASEGKAKYTGGEYVVAMSQGYYGEKLRLEGEKFLLESPDDFSFAWMKEADSQEAPTNDGVSEKRMKKRGFGDIQEGPGADEPVQARGSRLQPNQEV